VVAEQAQRRLNTVLEGKHSTEKVTQCWKINTAQRRLNAVLEGKHSTEKVTFSAGR
jgi:hypothetical protein